MSEFLDHLTLTLSAGDGGNGCVSFRREKFVPKGGPDGGNGGRGGHVIFKASSNFNTLAHITPNATIRAERGAHGLGKNRQGANGKDAVVMVPRGTIVKNAHTDEIICELLDEDQQEILAKGGSGGQGNASYARSNRQTPRFSKPGGEGETIKVALELKLLADVGLLGLPNAGKSTLTARISAARPAVADYPFTTLYPVLGVVKIDWNSFVVADIPGLIEGASKGVGLGHTFLRHIERTRLLLHLVDIGSEEADTPEQQVESLSRELQEYDDALAGKPRIIAGNKIDLNPPPERLEQLKQYAEKRGYPVFFISGATGEGVDELVKQIFSTLANLKATEELLNNDGVGI